MERPGSKEQFITMLVEVICLFSVLKRVWWLEQVSGNSNWFGRLSLLVFIEKPVFGLVFSSGVFWKAD